MYQQITIKTLDKQGERKAAIAKQMGCHRNTVRNVLKRVSILEKQTRSKSSEFTPYKEKIDEWLKQDISRRRIIELLWENYGVKQSYDTLCKYIQKQFPKQKEAFGVQQVEPGEVAEIDFGEIGMLPGPLGKLTKTYGLAVILPYSRLDFYAICYDQKLETLCHELENAFLYFGGVPKKLKVDNMKTAILKNQHYDLEFNQDFLEFAYHYNTVIKPCTPYSPQQKGTVESGIKYLQGNFVAGRVFKSEADLRGQLKDWMDNYANKRVHGTTRRVPMEVFWREEATCLQLLPDTSFAFFNRSIRIVAPNCHIHFENNYYSVPASLVGKEVTVRWNDSIVRIIYQGEQIALHKRCTGLGNYVTVRNHLPDYKVYSETEYQERFEAKMASIGEHAHQYFSMLLQTKESYWGRVARAILGLSNQYGAEAVNLSLKRAMYYQATDLPTIKNILEKKLYLIEPEQQLTHIEETTSNSRDLSYYQL